MGPDSIEAGLLRATCDLAPPGGELHKTPDDQKLEKDKDLSPKTSLDWVPPPCLTQVHYSRLLKHQS